MTEPPRRQDLRDLAHVDLVLVGLRVAQRRRNLRVGLLLPVQASACRRA